MTFDPNRITFFAKTDARGENVPFGIKAIDRQRHMYVIGKTGMGKSTLLENMAVQDMQNGEGLAFIDPHGATAELLLDYVPEERKNDVLYFAPFDTEHPVAFNVMEDVGPEKRHLVVSGLMSVFKKIWVDAWSARMEYILQNTLLALLEYPDSTLLGVNRMLSEKHFRKKVIDNITDPAVKSFWVDEFLNYNERYMQEAGDAIKNKIGQFTANPLIRNIIGQPHSSFDIRKMMDEKKIIIVNLSKGLVGESNANLLGSMLTTRIYLAAMSRADLPQAQMKEAPNFYFYVDEFQSFANATFADILSEARKYKLNLTIAHQYIEQMEEEVRNAVFGNVGTIVSFRVGPFDAEVLETIFAPQFYAVDVCNLGFAQVYLTLMIDGIGSSPFSAVTLPPIETPQVSCKDIVINSSRKQFACSREEAESYINDWHFEDHGPASNGGGQTTAGGSGAKKRSDNTAARQSKPQQTVPPSSSSSNNQKGLSDDRSKRDDTRSTQKQTADKKGTDINEKKLAELRAVLAGLSQNEIEKEHKSKKEDTGNNDGNGKRNERVKNNDTQQKSEKNKGDGNTNAKKDEASDQAMHLKEALSGILKEQSTSGKKEVEIKGRDTERAANTERNKKQIEKNNTDGKVGAKDNTRSETTATANQNVYVAAQQEKTTTDSQEQKTNITDRHSEARPYGISYAEAKSYDVSNRIPKKDPLDPKKLERMMRVKTTDKTPLK